MRPARVIFPLIVQSGDNLILVVEGPNSVAFASFSVPIIVVVLLRRRQSQGQLCWVRAFSSRTDRMRKIAESRKAPTLLNHPTVQVLTGERTCGNHSAIRINAA